MYYIFRQILQHCLLYTYPYRGPLQDISGSVIMEAALIYRMNRGATEEAETSRFQLGSPIHSSMIAYVYTWSRKKAICKCRPQNFDAQSPMSIALSVISRFTQLWSITLNWVPIGTLAHAYLSTQCILLVSMGFSAVFVTRSPSEMTLVVGPHRAEDTSWARLCR